MLLPTCTNLFPRLALTLYILNDFSADTNVNASSQQITFFENYGCYGEQNVTFTNTQDELNSIWVANSSSMHILGIWSITVYREAEGGSLYGYSYVFFNTKPPEGLCVDKTEWGMSDPENYQVYFADPRGPADMTTSQIIFYTGRTFQGLEYIAEKNEIEKLPPRPFAMWSQLQFSNDSWTAYSEANFVGNAIIFRPEKDNGSPVNPPEDYFQHKDSFVGIIGSVKKITSEGNDNGASGCTKTLYKGVLAFITYLVFFI